MVSSQEFDPGIAAAAIERSQDEARLRDYFAGQSLTSATLHGPVADIARRAYEIADAMLAARCK